MADLTAMSIDELDTLSLSIKAEMRALREQRLEIAAVRARKSNAANIAAKLNVDVSDLTDEQIDAIGAIQAKPRPGDVTAVPGTAAMEVKGQGGDDDA